MALSRRTTLAAGLLGALAILCVRVAVDSRAALRGAQAAEARGDRGEAVRLYLEAARLYLPASPFVTEG